MEEVSSYGSRSRHSGTSKAPTAATQAWAEAAAAKVRLNFLQREQEMWLRKVELDIKLKILEAERDAAAKAAYAETYIEEEASRRRSRRKKSESTPRTKPVRFCSDPDKILQSQPKEDCASSLPPTHGGEIDCIKPRQPQSPPSKHDREPLHQQPGDFTNHSASQHQPAASPSSTPLTKPVRFCSDPDKILQSQPNEKCASSLPPTHGGEMDCIEPYQPQSSPSKHDREAPHQQPADSFTSPYASQHPSTTVPSHAYIREKDNAPASASASEMLSDRPTSNNSLVAINSAAFQPGKFGYEPAHTKGQSVSMIFSSRSLKLSWSLNVLSTARCIELHLVGTTTVFWHFTSMVGNPTICHKSATQTPAPQTHHPASQLSAPTSARERRITHQPLPPAKPVTQTPALKVQHTTTPQFPPAGNMTQNPPALRPLRSVKGRKTFKFFGTFLPTHPPPKTLLPRSNKLRVHLCRSLKDLRLLFADLWKNLRKVPL